MRDYDENEPKWGILSVLCYKCCKENDLSNTVSSETYEPSHTVSSDEGVLRTVQLSILTEKEQLDEEYQDNRSLIYSPKSSQGKSNSCRLELPTKMLQIKRMESSELWAPHGGEISNWDVFFKTQRTASTQRTAITQRTGMTLHTVTSPTSTLTDIDELMLHSQSLNTAEVRDSVALGDNIAIPISLRRRDEIFLTNISKNGIKYTSVPWDMRIEEIATWLNKGSTQKIPISRDIQPKMLIQQNIRNFRKQTLREVFGDYLDPEKAGISFFIGPVEGKMFFKMTVCDLELLEKTARKFTNQAIAAGELIKYVG